MTPSNVQTVDRLSGQAIQTLAELAQLSNHLAKKLPKPLRADAYRIKSELSSLLLMIDGAATVNGVALDGTVGLTITGTSVTRFHVPQWTLRPEARAVASRQASHTPVVSPLSDRLNHKSLAALESKFTRSRSL